MTVPDRPVRIFVPSRGQYDNVGDIILRRQLLDWLRPLGELHTYVGMAPSGYEEGLRLAPEDVRYGSFSAWYRAALAAAARGEAVYAFKPGEIQLTVVGMKEHLSVLPLVVLARLRGGTVVRVGSGSRNFARFPRLLMSPSVRAAQFTAWRDAETARYVGRGEVMPDLAFGEGDLPVPGRRDRLVVSLRSDRPMPDPDWIAGVRAAADELGLSVIAVSQVLRDRERTAELATALGGEVMDWDGTAADLHEVRLREVYRSTAVALSDRLHVLIAAYTEGAAPVAAVPGGSPKIDRHFAAAGIEGISVDTAGVGSDTTRSAVVAAASRRAELAAALPIVRAALDDVRARMGGVIRPSRVPATDPVPA